MEFRLLGPLEVVSRGRPLLVGGGKRRSLLAILLLHANEVVSAERLIDELWGERPPATAAKSVHVYVSQLRKVSGRTPRALTVGC
jgi:DNA-binding SARP family transcriptional activator